MILYRSVVLKRELCTKAKLFVFRSAFVPNLTDSHECWVMIERVRSRIKVAEIEFLRKVRDLSLLDKVKNTDIRKSLNIELLLLHIERLQLRWYGHVARMFHKRTEKQLMLFRVAKGLQGDPEPAGEIMLKTWPGHVLEFHQQNCR